MWLIQRRYNKSSINNESMSLVGSSIFKKKEIILYSSIKLCNHVSQQIVSKNNFNVSLTIQGHNHYNSY